MTAYGYPRDPTAVVGRRILAYAIDVILAFGVVLALLIPYWRANAITTDSGNYTCPDSSTSFEPGRNANSFCFDDGTTVTYLPDDKANELSSRFYGAWFVFGIGNLVLLQGATGASVGKLITGLRVVRADGRTAHIGWAALRYVVLIFDQLCCFLPGAVLVFSTKGHRRIGDMAASTFVVSRRDVGQPVAVPGLTSTPYAAPQWNPGGWAPPAPPGPTAPTTPPAAPSDGPTWDEARGTYIQYDRNNSQWVQWDEAGSRWKPIDS